MKRNQSLDLIKVVAMLMVVMMHLGLARGEAHFKSPDLPVGPFTGIAIPMFFMVSGYLLSTRVPSWYYSRKKIWGILRFCLCICIPLSIIMTATSGHLVMLFPECLIQEGRIYQYWYFGSMMIIYAILPFLLRFIQGRWLSRILVGIGLLCTSVFILNILYGFERHIIQTFRIWNWLFYFLLGAYIRMNETKFQKIKWYWIIPSIAIYILFFNLVKIGANEYYFCSPLCMTHSTICFTAIINLNISNSKLLSLLSNCFLPVYTFHTFIEVFLCSKTSLFRMLEHFFQTSVAYTLEYIIVAISCLSISLILMRIPYMDKIFRI